MKDKELLNELNDLDYDSVIKDYLERLINLSISPFHDLDSLNKIKLNKLEYEIIKFNLISKSIESLQEIDNIKISKKNNFNIKYKNLDILTIQFLKNIYINVYDRKKIQLIINSLTLEIKSLENSMNINLNRINYLKAKLDILNILKDDIEVINYDKIINDSLNIPTNKGVLVAQDDLYKTNEIFSNKKILIYKDSLY